MTKLFAGAAVAVAMMASAGAASAATTFDLIDSGALSTNGTDFFGAAIDNTGTFTHEYDFTVSGSKDASGSVVTIRTSGGLKDIDFTSIDLDGAAFTQLTGDPTEVWSLETLLIGPGTHKITVKGNVLTTGTGVNAASYAGTINVVPVPEPATWGLMIAGFGGAGAMLRSRRRTVAA